MSYLNWSLVLIEPINTATEMYADSFWQTAATELAFEASLRGIIVDITPGRVVMHVPHLGQPPLIIVGSVEEALFVLQHI